MVLAFAHLAIFRQAQHSYFQVCHCVIFIIINEIKHLRSLKNTLHLHKIILNGLEMLPGKFFSLKNLFMHER